MAGITVATENVVKQWDSKYFTEYVRGNLFYPYMGTSENSAIQINEKLGKLPGDAITCSLIGKLSGAGVGAGALEGNEEALGNYGHAINIAVKRNAVLIDNFDKQQTAVDLRNAAKTQLMNWSMDNLRGDIIEALHSRNSGTSVNTNYGSAAAGLHDTWNADNVDRVHYVGLSTPSGGHTADLAGLATTDVASASAVSLCRRMARTADPHIRPIRVNGSEEWFVMFADPYLFRDLRDDSTINNAQRDAWQRGANNPLFRAGDIIYDGVIIREIPEIASYIDDAAGTWGAGATANSLKTAGTTSNRVGVAFMCGAQAVGVAWGKRTKSTTDVRDYGFLNGVGVEEFRGVEKLCYQSTTTNRCDHGVVTLYAAAATD